MKKIFILSVLSCLLFLTGCEKNFSNISVKKLNEKAAEYMQAGQYPEAAARLEASLDLNSDYLETYYNLGVAYYEMNDYEKSLKALNSAIEKKSDFADAYYTRALVYEDWAYSILEGEDVDSDENQQNPTKEDKETSLTYLQNAKVDFEKYLKLKPNADDKNEIQDKLVQINNDISNGINKD